MPLAVDPAHPFPYISGLSLNLSVRVRSPKTGKEEFARLKVPPVLPRFVQLPDDQRGLLRFIPLEDLISNHLDELFPGMEILEHHEFRVTRNEDVEVEEDESENLIQTLERELLQRRFGPPIRLEITDDMDDLHARAARPGARHHRAGGVPAARPARPRRPVRGGQDRPARC